MGNKLRNDKFINNSLKDQLKKDNNSEENKHEMQIEEKKEIKSNLFVILF